MEKKKSRYDSPFNIASLKPIQMPNLDLDEIKDVRCNFTKDEWIALLNDALDPFDKPIAAENLDLVYLENGLFRASSGVIRGESYLYRK